ncbi:MAG: hypothetical protein QW165_01160 [Candidatus Woesearchaeota archaeon]
MFSKGALKKYGISILLTLIIIGIVFLIGPAAALILSIDGLPVSVTAPGSFMFFLNFDIGSGELIPGGFTVNMNGNTCEFDNDANPIGGSLCPQINCEVVNKGSSSFGIFNANGFFDGYGYGYGYRYGYGYENGELRYKCTITLPCGLQGTGLTLSFSTEVDGMTFTSPSHSLALIPQSCGGTSGGGGGGGQGYCCEPVVNFAKWRCCQKAYIARIQCCAQPQHPDCSRYCKLMECIKPYTMDPIVGRCVLGSQNEPGFGNLGQDSEVKSTPQDGFAGTGQSTQMGGEGTGGFGAGSQGGSAGGPSGGMSWATILAIILVLLGLGLLAWLLSRRS